MPGIADDFAVWAAKTYRGMATKADPAGSLIVSSYGLSQPVRTPRRFDKLADEGYSQNPLVYRGVDVIATACAGIRWGLFQQSGRVKRGRELEQHPLLDLLQRPNDQQGYATFAKSYISYLYIAGNSYVWANRAKTGAPAELWIMRPDRMRVIPDEKQFVSGYTYEVNGRRIDFDKLSVLHTRMFAPLDDFYGMSPLAVAARAIDIHNAGSDWNLALLQNSGRVPGFFVTKERLGDKQFERMREELLDRYTGSRNVGLPGLLEEGIGWVEAGKTPQDMDWANLTKEEARYIAITIGVPPELLGDSEVKTYANYQEARASFYEETVLPLMDFFRDELNRWLVPMYDPSLYLDYDREDIEALQEQRAKLYMGVAKASFLTINEQRDVFGYPARPEGDLIVVPLTTAPLDEVANGTQVHLTPPSMPLGGTPAPEPPKPAPPADAHAPADDAPGGAGIPDGGMASGVDANAKSMLYDPLDDILAGNVVDVRAYRPKARRPQGTRPRPARSRYHLLTDRASS